MSIAYQADVFCDGGEVLGKPAEGCSWFIEQGVVEHDSVVGLAKGAWSMAERQGWARIRSSRGAPFLHLCPRCDDEYRIREAGQ